ncbi:hypothetical protein BJY52DRAFT_1191717 [Lactarius psammicola]|nr:hypothetical protein BJY52DRAFT_1191717 [Lactarius psammicola]
MRALARIGLAEVRKIDVKVFIWHYQQIAHDSWIAFRLLSLNTFSDVVGTFAQAIAAKWGPSSYPVLTSSRKVLEEPLGRLLPLVLVSRRRAASFFVLLPFDAFSRLGVQNSPCIRSRRWSSEALE